MAQLLVRNIEEAVVRKLRQKAAKDGVSMEEEHRRILRTSLLGKSGRTRMNFKDFLLTVPDFGQNADAHRKGDYPRDIEL